MTETAVPSVQRPLGILESSGLIRLAATNPELEYLFKHVLVQDAAYDSLLKQERRRLHTAVADTLEQLYPERREELAAMLAYHCEAAGDPARALPLLVSAGEHAVRRYANVEATGFFDRAAELVPAGDDPTLQRLRAEIALGRTTSGYLNRPIKDSLAILEPAMALAEAVGDQALLGQIHLYRSILHSFVGANYDQPGPFRDSIDAALAIAERTGNASLRGTALTVLGRGTLMSHNPKRATEVLEEAISLTQDGDFIGTSLAADTLAMAYAFLGDWERADAAIERSRELAIRSGDPKALIDSDISASSVEAERGNLEEAVRRASQGATRAMAIGAPACAVIANFIAGSAELALGRADRAVKPLTTSLQMATELGEDWFQARSDAALSSAHCALGDPEAARAGWDRTLAAARAMGDPLVEGQILRDRAMRLADHSDADWNALLADLDRAETLFEQMGVRPQLARLLAGRAIVLERAGRNDEAADALRRAKTLAAELGIEVGPVSTPPND